MTSPDLLDALVIQLTLPTTPRGPQEQNQELIGFCIYAAHHSVQLGLVQGE